MSRDGWETIETVGDEAAADVLNEALTAAEIVAELRRVPASPYGPVKLEIEVRVAGADAARARAVLAQLAEEAEAAARSEAHAPTASEPPPPPRQRKLWLGRPTVSDDLRRTLYTIGAAVTLALIWALFSQWHCAHCVP